MSFELPIPFEEKFLLGDYGFNLDDNCPFCKKTTLQNVNCLKPEAENDYTFDDRQICLECKSYNCDGIWFDYLNNYLG